MNSSADSIWEPLPAPLWNEEAAAHLLRRLGFSARPEAVADALTGTPQASIRKAFAGASGMERSESLADYEKEVRATTRAMWQSRGDPEAQRQKRQELRRQDIALFQDYAMSWFAHARQPENSALEKFVLFLQNIFVVQRTRVQMTPVLFSMQQTLRESLNRGYPDLCKAISREPAMARYLDLARSTREQPNENFARELFELFTLGEGHYTEQDVKESARAFTGYRVREQTEFFFQRAQHDSGRKTIFGETGNWNGDDVIDLIFRQPAARTFLIRELINFYLTTDSVPETQIEELGDRWAAQDFRIDYLLLTFFQSQLFFDPAYRGNLIKCPTHFYLGLCQDLDLDIVPFEARLLRSMDAMGQSFYNPPNVRGWLYGPNWINSTTVSARRQLVDYLFTPLREDQLNANEQQTLKAVRETGQDGFLFDLRDLREGLPDNSASGTLRHLTTHLIPPQFTATYEPILADILQAESPPWRGLRFAVLALLKSPAYNLC